MSTPPMSAAPSPTRADHPPGLELDRCFPRWPIRASLEVDRFCLGCGYNLFGQQVRQDPASRLLFVCCPECGRYAAADDGATAGRVWLGRVGTLLLLGLIVAHLLVIAGLALAQLINLVVVFNTTIDYVYSAGMRGYQVADWTAETVLAACLCSTASIVMGFAHAALLPAAVPHWRPAAWLLPVAVWAIGSLLVMLLILWADDVTGQRYGDAWSTIWLRLGVQTLLAIGAAAVAAGLGRRTARLLVTWFVPPRLWPVLAYLWRFDDREPPKGTTSAATPTDRHPSPR